jgi:hypothetical protein
MLLLPTFEAKAVYPPLFLGHSDGLLLVVTVVSYGATSWANRFPDDDRLLLKIPIALMNPLRDLHLAPPTS